MLTRCLLHIKDKILEKKITDDLYLLQLSANEREFRIAFALLLYKYQKEIESNEQVKLFFEYFASQWITSSVYTWYEGAAYLAPSTNNALESFNRVIKSTHTLLERFSLSVFLSKLGEMLNKWSKDQEKDKPFFDKPLILDTLWEEVDEFIDSKPKVKFISELNCYLVSNKDVTNKDYARFYDSLECDLECELKECFSSFDEFVELYRLIKRVTINKSTWELSKCTCYTYFKEFICKHIVFMAVNLKLTEMNYEYKKLGKKNKRGAKKKATPALLKM